MQIVHSSHRGSRIEHQTGWSIRKFVKTARRYRTVQIHAGPHVITAADPPARRPPAGPRNDQRHQFTRALAWPNSGFKRYFVNLGAHSNYHVHRRVKDSSPCSIDVIRGLIHMAGPTRRVVLVGWHGDSGGENARESLLGGLPVRL